ncbi:hypothetical protein PSHT_14851 [Puccinia striiformis]|uniref:Uncharacterized protein n=1 Tax=Puccinia striiformis TaxID=27350 RepID=A0A2S4UI84_9BASI|nr:hypothetical protein PSHT_14851 [Puccinia striiformis]
MVSRLKNLFTKSKSDEPKFSRKLDALLCRGSQTLSSQSISSKKTKDLRPSCSRGDPDSKINVNSRRVQIRISVTQQNRYPSVLCSPDDSPEGAARLEQTLPLLSKNPDEESENREALDAPRSLSPLACSPDSSSLDSHSSDSHYFENVTSQHSAGSSEILEIRDAAVRIKFREAYFPPSSNDVTQNTRAKLSRNLMNALSSHEIEWAAMVELEKADHTGILRGLSSRQIRWLVREGRCKTWLVGKLGPLMEQEKGEAQDGPSLDGVELTDGPAEDGDVPRMRKYA